MLFGWIALLLFYGPAAGNSPAPELFTTRDFTADLQNAIRLSYARQPDSVQMLFEPWKARVPEHPLWGFWDGFELWWAISEDLSDERYDERFYTLMAQNANRCELVLKQNPSHLDALVLLATGHAFSARLAANRADWFTSLSYTRKCYAALNRIRNTAPSHPDLLFADGMLMYYADVVPKRYPLARVAFAWFVQEANSVKGLEKIKQCSKSGLFMRYESTYFMGNLLLYYERKPAEALRYTSTLSSSFPENPFFVRHQLRLLLRLNKLFELEGLVSQAGSTFYEKRASQAMEEELAYIKAKGLLSYGSPERLGLLLHQRTLSEALPQGKNRPLWILATIEVARERMQKNEQAEAKKLLSEALSADKRGRYSKEILALLKEISS